MTEDVSFAGNRMIVLVSGEATDGAMTVLDETVPPGWAPPKHIHHRAVELLYVLEGSYQVEVGDRTIAADPGSHVLVNAGDAHTWLAGADGGRMLIVFAPSGMDRYFAELAADERAQTGVPPDRRGRLERYGMEILDNR